MFSSINLLCTVILLSITWHGIQAEEPPDPPPGMKLLGSKALDNHFYFISQNTASWTKAMENCKKSLGGNASLLGIETKEELENIFQFLKDSDDTGSSYWTSGRYVPAKDAFEWEDGVPFGSWAPWDEGQPNSKFPVTKVYLYTATNLKFLAEPLTTSLRYMCELSVN